MNKFCISQLSCFFCKISFNPYEESKEINNSVKHDAKSSLNFLKNFRSLFLMWKILNAMFYSWTYLPTLLQYETTDII